MWGKPVGCLGVLLVLLLPLDVLSQGLDLLDALDATPSPAPPAVVPKAPAKPKPVAEGDFDLADALDEKNDPRDKNKNQGNTGGGFSDKDLADVAKDIDKDKGKGRGAFSGAGDGPIHPSNDNTETQAEVGTIAGIASAVAMALVGAVTSYISYQKKKLCFSIQQSLNADFVKAENPDAVVATEPQVQQTLLEPPNAEPPVTEENTV
ncbi:CD99 antigen-like protein 2 [Neosynchiropus ocellatus]